MGFVGFCFALDGKSLKYFEQMTSSTIYRKVSLAAAWRPGSGGGGVGCLEGDGAESGTVTQVRSCGQTAMRAEGRAGRTC